jgi:hypothetical protein
MHLLRFFKWFYHPDVEPDKRPKPSVIENIPKLKRNETSVYKPSDLWTQHDDLLFMKYSPSKGASAIMLCPEIRHAVRMKS